MWHTIWWQHQMEKFSLLLAIHARNSPVTGEFPAQRPVTWNFDVFFDLRLNKRLSKQLWGWWFETPSCSLRCHCNESHWEYMERVMHMIWFLFCFMVVSLWLIFPISFRVTSLTLGQSYNCEWSNPEEYGFIHNVEYKNWGAFQKGLRALKSKSS